MASLVATYRVQLGPDHGFDAATALVGHLAELGVSHLYASPVTEAVEGSTHGYDVVDHTSVRVELGGREGLHRLANELQGRGLGLVVDTVPNHASVAVPRANRQWWEMLQHGPDHPSARFFDVDWDAGGRVVLPILGEPLPAVMARGGVTVAGEPEPLLVVDGTELPLAPGTADLPLEELLAAQHYRLVHWRTPERNVRRFFTIDDLVAVRAEEPEVAAAVDAIPAALRDRGHLDGVRVDHVDGLADPGGYLHALRQRCGDAWIVVEKILAPDERVPRSWPVDGTTGYDFVRIVDHLFVDRAGMEPLTALWTEVAGDPRDFDEIRREARREVLAAGLAPDLDRLARVATGAVPERGVDACREALRDLTVEIGRYRTYLPEDDEGSAVIRAAAVRAMEHGSADPVDVTALVDAIVAPTSGAAETLRTRWQQLCAPVVAKGDEDRAFYRYHRLVALCEVGGEPGEFGIDVDAFHDDMLWRAANEPRSLLAGSTHDTKRSEDVRARLLVLSEVPGAWESLVGAVLGGLDPEVHPADAYLALQTAVGAWPLSAARLGAYCIKAAREASQRTTWTDPVPEYEDTLQRLARWLSEGEAAELIGRFAELVAPAGWRNSLGQVVLRCTGPGVPDIYQGCETWNLRLVDPDNRVGPDWDDLARAGARARTTDIDAAWPSSAAAGSGPNRPPGGAIKTALMTRLLALRRSRPASFLPAAGYEPLVISGPGSARALAYRRGDDVVVVVARHTADPDARWSGTELQLPEGSWHDALGPRPPRPGGNQPLGELLGPRSATVLVRV